MKWYNIRNQSEERADVYIFDEIGAWGITANEFRKDFAGISAENVTVHINSPGGSVFDGLAIYNILRGSGLNISVQIEGLAASIASVIAMAGENVVMAKSSMMMIHNPFVFVGGDSEDLKRMADMMDQLKGQFVEIYQAKSGLEKEEIENLMSAETWMTASTCKKKGFCDEISESLKIAAFADIDKYEFRNQAIFDKFKQNLTKKEETEEVNMEITKVIDALGVSAEDQIVPEIQTLKDGLEDANSKIELYEKELAEMKVDLAIAQSKIAPAQRDFAIKMLQTNEETYKEWLEQNKPEVPESNVKIEDGKGSKDMTYEDLLDDPELEVKIKETNPKLYNRLYDEYIAGGTK
jgi:ATP-dependent Clp endopeptidase proteolytic subunit ClpP